MQEVYLINHRGGDGVNFIMSLLNTFLDGFNKSFIRRTNDNEYINDHVFKNNSDIECTKKIQLNIENNLPYNEGLELKKGNGIRLQQMHSNNKKLKDNLNKYFNNDSFLCVKTEDIDTQFLFAKLDIIKNKHISNKEYFHSRAFMCRQFILGRDKTYDTQYDINYNKMILEADYNEFTKLCNYFKQKNTLKQDKFKELVNEYTNSNQKLLNDYLDFDEYYNFFTNEAKKEIEND